MDSVLSYLDMTWPFVVVVKNPFDGRNETPDAVRTIDASQRLDCAYDDAFRLA